MANTSLFRRFGLLTILSVILLILVGGIVRATGSGMGCPDWPKCFGMWVPPTHISQLPVNYEEIFGAKLKGEVVFSPVKTWIEYLNRLLGALIGLFIFITFIFSLRAFRNTSSKIVIFSFIALVLVLVEGWLGSKVVSTELHPVLITIHMVLSLVILGFLVFAVAKSYMLEGKLNVLEPARDKTFLFVILLVFMVGQICFGTQIREGIDLAQKMLGDQNRSLWTNSVMGKILFHGGFSLVIFSISFILWKKAKVEGKLLFNKSLNFITVCIGFSILSGALLGFAGFPALAQPVHLVLSVLIITAIFLNIYLLNPEII